MRFLYKIHSGYDGFYPAKISSRMEHGTLRLGWKRYIDVVEEKSECWVYFHGQHKFENGVYVKGVIDEVDRENDFVVLRVKRYQSDKPIVAQVENQRISEIVKVRYRQVFLWPKEWPVSECKLSMCADRQCDNCVEFKNFPLINGLHVERPQRLSVNRFPNLSVVSAHWVVPSRCHWNRNEIIREVQELTRRFYEFKLGEKAYAYPFALAIFRRLQQESLTGFDCVVPIPLSPEKKQNREVHRTLRLAQELAKLLGIPLREYLCLYKSVSKRRMLSQGFSEAAFRNAYYESLNISISSEVNHILLVDDVVTRGSTVEQTLRKIREHVHDVKVTVATAGQMIVKPVVSDVRGFLAC